MKRDDAVRLHHMLDAARKTRQFIQGRIREDLERDEQLTLAVIRLLEIIGEAAKNVSLETQQQYPDIRWKEIGGTRNRLIHGYFDVDLDILWQILTSDLPPLISVLEKAVASSSA